MLVMWAGEDQTRILSSRTNDVRLRRPRNVNALVILAREVTEREGEDMSKRQPTSQKLVSPELYSDTPKVDSVGSAGGAPYPAQCAPLAFLQVGSQNNKRHKYLSKDLPSLIFIFIVLPVHLDV